MMITVMDGRDMRAPPGQSLEFPFSGPNTPVFVQKGMSFRLQAHLFSSDGNVHDQLISQLWWLLWVTVVACEGWMDGSLMRVEKVSPSTVSRVWKAPQRFHCHGLSCPCCIKLSRCCVSQCWDFAYTATFAGPNLVCNLLDYLKVHLALHLSRSSPLAERMSASTSR